LNPAFKAVIGASDSDRRDLFLGTAARMGTAVQNVEKDFWVCWTLDALFNGLPAGGPRLLFKGGTSLSKAFRLITRFSEDIDITVFRNDLGHAAEVAELDALSGRKRRARLDAIRTACQDYIGGPLKEQFTDISASSIPDGRFQLELDPDDSDGQTLLFWYPAVADQNLSVANINTVKPERTFWDKVMILHGLRQWHDRRGELRHGGQRISRHYYDVHQLMQAGSASQWQADHALAIDCAHHARLFFGSTDLGLDTAVRGTFTLAPGVVMRDALARDYDAMAGMVFGDVPALDAVLASVQRFEQIANQAIAEP
jgi:hypothetical protein